MNFKGKIKLLNLKKFLNLCVYGQRKQMTSKENPIRLSSDFSTAMLFARRKWYKIKTLKERKCVPRFYM